MIIYSETKDIFFNHVKTNKIADTIKKNFLDRGMACNNEFEINAWNNSMQFMKNILDHNEIPNDINIAIEYKIPFSEKRIDFIVTGLDENNHKSAVIVELKQWQEALDTNKTDLVRTYVAKAHREVLHPSYQANQYKYLLSSFNKEVNEGRIECYSCAYLHNAAKIRNMNLLNVNLYNYLDESPLYFKEDYEELQKKIIKLTKNGKGKEILYEIENGEVVPAKKLIEVVGNTLKGNKVYELIDTQKIVFENILSKKNSNNNVFIINGNPGTGKSVVAINLLSKLLHEKKSVVYVAPNAAFKNVMRESLKKYVKNTKEKIAIDILFKGSSSFYNCQKDLYDWIIVDEAHRLVDKKYMYKGNNQIFDVLNASKNTIFFVDEKQTIRPHDIGTNKNIIELSKQLNKNIYYGSEYELQTQFRCAGADGYINAIDNILQITETGNFYLNEQSQYEIKICETPHEMHKLIEQKIEQGYTNSRIVAGYAWEWNTKGKSLNELVFEHDIKIGDYSIPWNYEDSNMLWAIRDDGVMQAGCIHTCQGLEFDYCGVIIGNDLMINKDNVLYGEYDNYLDSAGKNGLKNKPQELTRLIKNIYKVLLTRGQKGTFIYICDPNLRNYFKKHIL